MYPVAVVGPRYGEVESSACDGCLRQTNYTQTSDLVRQNRVALRGYVAQSSQNRFNEANN